jgi:hypothetical protein
LTEKAINIGVGEFHLDFLNKALETSPSDTQNIIPEILKMKKEEVNNNYREYLQKLVEYEQNKGSIQNRQSSLKNLEAGEIVPNLNFFPDGAPQDYPPKLLQFWENVLQDGRVDNDNYSILLKNGLNNKEKQSSKHGSFHDLLKIGQNDRYLKQENFEIRTLGNYTETRFLLSLQTLVKNRNDLTIVVPNIVAAINTRLKGDVVIIKQDQQNPKKAKILVIDCKSSRRGCMERNDARTPSIAYSPPKSNLYHNPKNQDIGHRNSIQQLNRDLNNFFNDENAYFNLPIIEVDENAKIKVLLEYQDIQTKLTNPDIFSKPSQNFYQLQDTEQARLFEQTISGALQRKYNENQKNKEKLDTKRAQPL